MRYLGLDLGSRTLGISISDSMGIIARTYKTIRHEENYKYLVNQIIDIIKLEKVDALVLGYPKNMNNTLGEKAKLSHEFKEMINKKINIPIFLQDERLTTVMANNVLINGNVNRKNRKKVVDQVAATIILQNFLDSEVNR